MPHFAVVLTLLLLAILLGSRVAGAEPPTRVTTDSTAYCQVLLQRILATPGGTHASPAQLAEEGRQLCASGHPRTGIAKLRRALRLALAEGQ